MYHIPCTRVPTESGRPAGKQPSRQTRVQSQHLLFYKTSYAVGPRGEEPTCRFLASTASSAVSIRAVQKNVRDRASRRGTDVSVPRLDCLECSLNTCCAQTSYEIRPRSEEPTCRFLASSDSSAVPVPAVSENRTRSGVQARNRRVGSSPRLTRVQSQYLLYTQ